MGVGAVEPPISHLKRYIAAKLVNLLQKLHAEMLKVCVDKIHSPLNYQLSIVNYQLFRHCLVSCKQGGDAVGFCDVGWETVGTEYGTVVGLMGTA